jgi:hypothetical protein
MEMETHLLSTVVRVDHSGYTVQLDPDGDQVAETGSAAQPCRCEVRGTLRRALKQDERQRIVVGDRVRVARHGESWVIEDVLPRRSKLARRAEARADVERDRALRGRDPMVGEPAVGPLAAVVAVRQLEVASALFWIAACELGQPQVEVDLGNRPQPTRPRRSQRVGE